TRNFCRGIYARLYEDEATQFMSATSLIIGLTGNIATGKSTVLEYLAAKGAYVIDADKLAHKVMEPGGPAYEPILQTFGRHILAEDGTINRQALAEIVFADPAALGRLEQIVHPAVYQLTRQKIEQVPHEIVILEAVKLLEAGSMATLCDEIWVVTSSEEAQLRRLREKRGMDEVHARQRMRMQSPQAAKVNQADRVIHNDGTLEELYAQLDALWQDLHRRYAGRLGKAEA
ncbi:dephospho-CoA kinase, partial [Litorilinea aerophila]